MYDQNTLDPKTNEILSILQEECAEVIQAISKVKRFGCKNNIDQLALEIGDMLYLTDLARIQFNELIDFDHQEHRRMKFDKLRKYSSIFKDSTYDSKSTP
jgi:NTP pyrophosphatase (non-canonical NTP hydrolase)